MASLPLTSCRPTALITGAQRGIVTITPPIPRWGQPEIFARVVCTMAQGLSPYTVGHAVRVDGGMSINRD